MKTSQHATQRCQSRGIPVACQEILLRYGTPIRRPGGATAYYLTEQDRIAAISECRRLLQVLDHARNAAIIVGDDGTCITAYKNPKRFWRQ